MCRLVALKHRSIKSYLLGCHFTPRPGRPMDKPLVEYTLAGIKRAEARAGAVPRVCLPIKSDIMDILREIWASPSILQWQHALGRSVYGILWLPVSQLV
jgi:hypothetical protein